MAKIVNHNNFPALETERLILRQMTIDDTDFFPALKQSGSTPIPLG